MAALVLGFFSWSISAGWSKGGALTRSETEQVVAKVAESIPSLIPCAFERQIPGARTSGNTVWLWPQEFGGNGMFIARWKKAAV